ncbi:MULTISPECIES: SDR family oxidoreductase [unclassified Fictibacillus]|uniref:SDR family oxidoreductase n=1 Tax=unclassified Fictibacillus TaxID=2644029 RepID=UPI0006A7D64E|nr:MULTISPECIES: SDR family oxidoreductase [unclassified Fictibacillus]MED2973628.1 SDR family oxidoreductase [Fictibacillus sp. B-59209]SFE05890.1 3-oxoacyl-[acyl-carrier protein] reductase [Bacillus sp. OV194]
MDLGLRNKAVLVLASSKGLGRATAMKFAEEGAAVMITSRDEKALMVTADEIRKKTGSRIEYAVCDITQKEEITRLVKAAADAFGKIDVLVNNAGGPPAGTFDSFGDEEWEFGFNLTLMSLVRTVREVLPYMRENGGGRIVNIASSSFKQPIDGLILSNTFRTAINGLSKSLSQELGKDGILINTIGPGRIGTDRVAELDSKAADANSVSPEQVKEQMEKSIPLGRYGTPEEFAKTIVYLGSEANTYITGQSFLIDGGMVKAL